jgi:hypothetical protein
MADEEAHFGPRTPSDTPPDYNENHHPFLPEQDYETDMTTYDFIYFVQDYSPFLREYLDYMHETYIEYTDIGYYNSFIDICNEIDTDEGDDGTFETYRATVEPFMEWMTEECGHMNAYYEQDMRNAQEAAAQQNVAVEVAPTGVASRTRSKRPATAFEIPSAKRGTNMVSLEPTKQYAARIKLSDGKEYTYDEIKDMWRFSKEQTPLRHPYTQEDKQKIKDFIDFATKGGKKKTRKGKKVRKTRKLKNKKVRKTKARRTRRK